MTFSEYIKTQALEDYYVYCKKKKLKPQIDVTLVPPKLCALVKPKLDPKLQ